MCGRYYIAEADAAEELRQIIEAVNRRSPDVKIGDGIANAPDDLHHYTQPLSYLSRPSFIVQMMPKNDFHSTKKLFAVGKLPAVKSAILFVLFISPDYLNKLRIFWRMPELSSSATGPLTSSGR